MIEAPLFIDHGRGLLELARSSHFPTGQRTALVRRIGRKGAGLSAIPALWTPPFFFIDTSVFDRWTREPDDIRERSLLESATIAAELARRWDLTWHQGLVIRSSATDETLRERGANTTIELAADYDAAMIVRAMAQIYTGFVASGGSGSMALAVQARVSNLVRGHISNEQRVSKTINHWMWEQEPADTGSGRFNSQREKGIGVDAPLNTIASKQAKLISSLRRVGRWATLLRAGRTHLEWGSTANRLWLYQLDFEEDQPDDGVDPTGFLRDGDIQPPGSLPMGSVFQPAPSDGSSGWSKIDKTASFIGCVAGAYPSLVFVTGDALEDEQGNKAKLINDLRVFARDRVVCRTDCRDKSIPSLNLPRTHTVSSDNAVKFMYDVMAEFAEKGVSSDDICFVLHKFIPSVTAAWAVARPGGSIVRVDSLWGLPDGLQYLPHDSYEYDLASGRQSTERPHYKHAFLQETETGAWAVVRILRKATRGRSLPQSDLAEVARITQKIANDKNEDVQVMWFCVVPSETGLARNIPWFSMKPHTQASQHSVSPTLRRLIITSVVDLEEAKKVAPGRAILMLEPHDPELFRSQDFLDKIIDVAETRNLPVALTGSILSHAFYVLEKAGLTVVALAEPTRTRTRQRRVFRKMVRDEIPAKIERGGEIVTLAEIAKEEARAALVCKLFEEGFELLQADTPQDVTAELADLLEVVKALAATTGVDWSDVNAVSDAKRQARGGFARNLVLLETSAPAWAESQSTSDTRTIPLSRLGQINRSEGGVSVGYPLLLPSTPPVALTLNNGNVITVKLDGNGLQIRPGEPVGTPAGQLDFRF
jgi:predicted house-cleaning noncanonical NTP pyrophosphatase (MazG superfamily)